jgi:large subunit ribosomal protein L29
MKLADLRALTNEELDRHLEELKEEMFNLRFQQSRNRLENPIRIREVRRETARVKTLQTERRNEV